MGRRPNVWGNALYRAANAAVLACMILFIPFFGISEVNWKHLLILFAVIGFLSGVCFLSAKGKILCLAVALCCLLYSMMAAGWETSRSFCQEYVHWCAGKGNWQEGWENGFGLLQAGVLSAAAFLLQVLLEKMERLQLLLAGCCMAGMVFCLFAQKPFTHMGVVFTLFYVALVYVEKQEGHGKEREDGRRKVRMLWLSPFLCGYLLLMALMPAPDTPYDWQWAKNLGGRIRDSFLTVSQNLFRGAGEDFGMSFSGFSEEGNVGGDLQEDDSPVMFLQARGDLDTNVYLIGKVCDTFDGRQWRQEYDGRQQERFLDTLETLYAVMRLDREYQRDYLRETDLTIRYDRFRTEYVFAPLKTRNIESAESGLEYSFEGSDLVWAKRKGYGTEYEAEYYQLNLGEELFAQLMEAKKEPDGALWDTIARGYEWENGEKITLEMLEAHRKAVYENYLDEVTLSKETAEYLNEITKDAATDLEKLKAIEKELQSFVYTTTPGELPKEITDAGAFLDYFLLEKRQGYCTYFATAFVLLARAQGFPARYVQGYCVPMEGKREAVVLSDMAHAWPEVYLDGVGWIPFEPAAGYETLRYTPWSVSPRSEEKVLEGASLNEEEPKEVQDSTLENFTEQEDLLEAQGGNVLRPQTIQKALLLCFFVCLVLIGADDLAGRYRYRRMSPEQRFKTEVKRTLRILDWLGFGRSGEETLQNLRERGQSREEMPKLQFIEDYENVIYGGRAVGKEMFAVVRDERKQLWRLLWKEKKAVCVLGRVRMLLFPYH